MLNLIFPSVLWNVKLIATITYGRPASRGKVGVKIRAGCLRHVPGSLSFSQFLFLRPSKLRKAESLLFVYRASADSGPASRCAHWHTAPKVTAFHQGSEGCAPEPRETKKPTSKFIVMKAWSAHEPTSIANSFTNRTEQFHYVWGTKHEVRKFHDLRMSSLTFTD